MPLYEYKCKSCGFQFEELVKKDSDSVKCSKCGAEAAKMISRFSSVITGGSINETVDMSIGREANKRWQTIHDRQSKRRGKKNLQDIPQPQAKDGKYMPVMALGGTSDRESRKEYTSALQEHRKKRVEKGIPQFSGPGEF